MKRQETPVRRTFDELRRQQLLIYASELGEGFREQQALQHTLSRYEKRIREMAVASVRAHEEQAQWIAYELHDSVAQTLASVYQQLQVLESMPRLAPKTRKVIVHASALLRQSIREARSIMSTLHPPGLEELGIVPVIEQELRDFQRDTKCSAILDANFSEISYPEAEMSLYRIFHEALMNIKKHATSAKKVTVSLKSNSKSIRLQVRDDGPGFDIKAAMQDEHVGGLMTMRRRAEVMGGTFKVTSIYGKGVRVNVRIPTNGRNWKRKASSEGDRESVAGTGGG